MDDPAAPERIREYAEQAVAYVQRALGVKLEYDSDTLPVMDHYLRTVPTNRAIEGDDDGGADLAKPAIANEQTAAVQLVLATAGAYFGEVVRRRNGGRWELADEQADWRVVLPTGLNFSPIGFVASAIAQSDLDDLDSELDAPPRMQPYVKQALDRMGEVTVEEYYSLCGRLDTLEHIHEVLVAVAAQMMGDLGEEDAGQADEEGAEGAVVEPVADEPSGGVN